MIKPTFFELELNNNGTQMEINRKETKMLLSFLVTIHY